MPTYRPFLGTTTDRDEAFPGIIELNVTVVQDPWGHYFQHEWQREKRYTKADIPRCQQCANPRCQQGGVDLQHVVAMFGEGTHQLYCNGHEGTPKGRRKGRSCDNSFEISVEIIRK
jgi:hypothetical protein